MSIKEIRTQLIDGLENEYTPNDIKFIDKRLQEIADTEHLSLKELNEYCWANPSKMFACIFDYADVYKEDFIVD